MNTATMPTNWLKVDGESPKPITSDGIHHAEFGHILKEAADSIGVECIFEIQSTNTRQEELEKFMWPAAADRRNYINTGFYQKK